MNLRIAGIVVFIVVSFPFLLSAQMMPESKYSSHDWQLRDFATDSVYGTSVMKAYNELLKGKKSQTVIVAVIDAGLDTAHEDLQGRVWTNTKEIPGNGVDDDKNGYVDDIHGWNFVGNLRKESFEEIREYIRLHEKFENAKDTVAIKRDPQYAYWQTILAAKNNRMDNMQGTDAAITKLINDFYAVQNYWSKKLHTDSVSFIHLKQELPADADSAAIQGRAYILSFTNQVSAIADSTTLITVVNTNIKPYNDENKRSLDVADTILLKNDPAYFRRTIMHDDPFTNNIKGYGNGNTFPNDPHGTECAGIIAALRNNGIGGNGITNSVAIMPLRINGMGHGTDEWDKDVANAIRYAADNGAQVISMSFGKYYSPQKEWVKAAVQYAAKKGVLLIHAAMNDATNTDSLVSYPQEYYSTTDKATNLINVGASTYDSTLVGDFSNYGKQTVDVFAPGTSLYMPILNGGYERGFGTSFACPMVAGLAAFIWSYYPQFTYMQVRQCIEASASPINIMVTKPGTTDKVLFSSLCKTGGIINAYKAIEEADKIKGKK